MGASETPLIYYSDLLLGQDRLKQHWKVETPFGREKPPLTVSVITTATVSPPSLFENVSPEFKRIAIKSHQYSNTDAKFITSETKKRLDEGITELSDSPWRVQVLVTSNQNHKRQMVVDYSQTIN